MIKFKYPRYKIKQMVPKVFLVTFDSAYDLAMTFLRYQEFYESPKWKGKLFTISDYMAWYAKTAGNGVFSYPKDYNGFNIPSQIITMAKPIDINRYDITMFNIKEEIEIEYDLRDKDFYLIGVSKERGDLSTLKHEIAHGLYTTNKEYRLSAQRLIRELPKRVRERIFKALGKRQYNRSVFVDEANAYLSTGFHRTWNFTSLNKYRIRFQKNFERFYV